MSARGALFALGLVARAAAADSTAPAPAPAGAPAPLLSLERTPCLGACPVYRVRVFADGTVEYLGWHDVGALGPRRGRLDAPALASLRAAFQTGHFFDLSDHYRSVSPDGAGLIVHYRDAGREKTVVADERPPEALRALAQKIDEAAGARRWVDEPPGASPPPIVTLEHPGCGGRCPAYRITVEADGTVVYEGRERVEVKGTRRLPLSPSQLARLHAAFEDAQFHSFAVAYPARSGGVALTLSYVKNRNYRETVDGGGGPETLKQLARRIEELVGARPFIDKKPGG